ncbi:MAG: hypothetical protein SVM80_02775 [Halobacteriota archaeon]|nr:hypothetical protein [Halobacteriota archaeon]
MVIGIIEYIAAAIVYMLGGALIIFIYGAYRRTSQENLLILAAGFFVLVFGSNFDTLIRIIYPEGSAISNIAPLLALLFQTPGLLLIFYSAVRD